MLLALSHCDEDLAETLILHGASIEGVDYTGRNLFHYAVWYRKLKLLENILIAAKDQNQFNILDQRDPLGLTPLHLATYVDDTPEVLRLMLNHTHDANDRTVPYGLTALHLAITNKYLNSLKVLMEFDKVDLNAPLPDKRYPLQYAIDINLPMELQVQLRFHGAMAGSTPETSKNTMEIENETDAEQDMESKDAMDVKNDIEGEITMNISDDKIIAHDVDPDTEAGLQIDMDFDPGVHLRDKTNISDDGDSSINLNNGENLEDKTSMKK